MLVLLSILIELLFISALILFLYRLKPWAGLIPLYVLIGANQVFQTLISTRIDLELFGGMTLYISPTIIFSAGLFTILLAYIKEGEKTTQWFILSIILANLSITFITTISSWQEIVLGNRYSPLNYTNFRVMIAGIVSLILDAYLMIILYEIIYTRLKFLNLYSRLVLTLLLILILDSFLFVSIAFWERPDYSARLISHLFSKTFTGIYFGSVLWVYLRYLDKEKTAQTSIMKGKEDIFSILTYKGQLEKLQTEKAISDEQMQQVISEKTNELEKSIRRFTILSSIRNLRMDRYNTSEQVKVFLEKAREAFEVDACTIHLLNNNKLNLLNSVGLNEEELEKVLDAGSPYFEKIISSKRYLAIEDTANDAAIIDGRKNGLVKFIFKSCLGLPLISADNTIGIIKLYSFNTKRIFTEFEIEHLQLVAIQAVNLIQTSKLFEQNEKHKEVLVKQIVARKKVEIEIRQSNERFELVGLATNDALWEWNLETNKVWGNEIHQNLYGLTIDDPVPGFDEWKRRIHPEERDQIIQTFNEMLASNNKSFVEEYRFYTEKKDWIYVYGSTFIERSKDGKPIRLVGSMQDITERKKAEEQIKNYNEQLRQLTGHLQTIREEERSRIGQEIHDQLGQHLTVLKMDVSRLKKNIPQGKNKEQDLSEILSELDNCLQMVRKISADLRPSIIDDLGIIAALEWQAEDFERRTEISTKFYSNVSELKMPQTHSIGLFRIFQESLTNVARHADAKKVVTSLNKENGFLVMTISDNGKGFEANSIGGKRSLGLLGMRERTLLMNGNYQINSIPGEGTEVKVIIPL